MEDTATSQPEPVVETGNVTVENAPQTEIEQAPAAPEVEAAPETPASE